MREKQSQEEERISASEDDSRWLRDSYFRQVNAKPLLSRPEELVWTRRFSQANRALQAFLLKIPGLFWRVFSELEANASGVRLANFFETRKEEDQEDEQNIRELFLSVASSLTSDVRKRLALQDGTSLLAAIAPLVPRDAFFAKCQAVLQGEAALETGSVFAFTEKLQEELAELQRQISQVMDVLVNHNLRLVISVAWHYRNSQIPLADLIQEGNIGLMRSIQRFDPERGHCFSTYACYWIRQAITHSLLQTGHIIRLPAHMIRQLQKISRIEQQLLQVNGVLPTEEEIAAELGISAARVRALRRMAMQPISFQGFSAEEQSLEEILPDTSVQTPLESAQKESLHEALYHVLGLLNQREQTILKLRFGLGTGKEQTFLEIAEQLGISAERVRQIEASALKKLRSPEMMQLLGDRS